MAEINWYYYSENRQQGPVSESDLQELLRSGQLPWNTQIWHDGMSTWTPANKVESFNPEFKPEEKAIKGKEKGKEPLLGILFSLICSGLGHLYAKRVRRAIYVFVVTGVLGVITFIFFTSGRENYMD